MYGTPSYLSLQFLNLSIEILFTYAYQQRYLTNLSLNNQSCRVGVGVGVRIFDPTPIPKFPFNYFSTCFACLFLPAAQASSSWALLLLIINRLMSLIN